MSNYRRPANYQITKHYKCKKCGHEQLSDGYNSVRMPCPICSGFVEFQSESYSSNPDEWDERRIGDINSPWINERTGEYLGR